MLTTHCFRFTTILSAQLLNFWSIICVVIVSFIFLHVRYKIPQILGILVCCAGMGILLYSDHIKFVPGSSFANKLRLTAFQWNKRRRSP
jgi:solute carrier family 35 protein F1/2